MNEFENKLVHIRRDFHKYPELGFKEKRTKAKIASYLRDLNLSVYEGIGIVGVLRSGTSNRAIGLRADIDALPITETNTHEYVSRISGVMHGCGHDGHAAMLLGAAEILSKSMDFDGTVVFLFQPNEENGLGALAMIEEGVLERFPIEEVYGIHNLPGVPVGQLSTRVGQICASENLFEITLNGNSGHAAMPHLGVDLITVGAEIVIALQTIVARKMMPGSGAVLSVTEFMTNGQRNILPSQLTLKGDARARHPNDRWIIEKNIRQLVGGITEAHGVETSVSFITEFIEVINAKSPTDAVIRTAKLMGLETIPNCHPMSFSEDFARLSDCVPGCFILLGNGKSGSQGKSLHSSDYDFNDEILTIGASFWAALAKDRLSSCNH